MIGFSAGQPVGEFVYGATQWEPELLCRQRALPRRASESKRRVRMPSAASRFDMPASGRQAKAGITRLAMRSIWPGSSVTPPSTRYWSPAATRSAIRALIRSIEPTR